MPVLLTNDFPPAVGGIQRYMERLAFALHDIGYPVCVVAPGPADDSDRPFPVMRFRATGKIDGLLQMDRALARARLLCNDGITLASTWNPAGLVAARRHAGSGKLAIFAMGAEVVRQETRLRRTLMRSTFERADVILSISSYTSQQLAIGGVTKRPALIYGGVEPWPRRHSQSSYPTILSVGRLVRRKGFDRVIEALPALRAAHAGLVYEIIGDGPDRDYLAELAARHGVSECVRFLGAVDDAVLHAAYERAWCFALPVRRDGSEVEGFGLVYIEAAAAGLASIGGGESGAEDAIVHGKTGLIVDGNDGREIGKALALLLRDRYFAALLGNAGRTRALRDFNWRRIATNVADAVGLRAGAPQTPPPERPLSHLAAHS